VVNSEVILKFVDFINLQYFILKLQHNANIAQGSHFLFTFSMTVVQINKIELTLTSNLTLTLTQNVHAKKCEKQLRNIIVSLLRYIILLTTGYSPLDRRRMF